MKVCELCAIEIGGRDGVDSRCPNCETIENLRTQKAFRAMARRKERDEIMRDLGLVKVRGALGGTYYE